MLQRTATLRLNALVFLLAAALAATAVRADDTNLTAPGARLQVLAGGFKFTEGPVADAQGDVFFTDIPANRIHQWSVTENKLAATFRENSGGANGLGFLRDGTLIACEGGNRRVVAISPKEQKVTVLADQYGGKKLNRPNDLWVDPNGGVYFSDPGYGMKKEDYEQDGEHVYYISPDRSKVTRVADGFQRPNGLYGTADGKKLYIADRGANKTFVYDVKADGTLDNRKLFCEEGSDGLKIDERGNVYITVKHINVYSPQGKLLTVIEMPKPPANLCFGGKDRKTLFITARDQLLSIQMAVKGQ